MALSSDAPLPRLANRCARRVFLSHHGLLAPPWPAPVTVSAHIEALGFVQVDSINTVMRAHDMILTARHKPFRAAHLQTALEKQRSVFEHWTHDASVLPVTSFPYWRHKFARDQDRLARHWQGERRAGFEAQFDKIMSRIAKDGPVSTADVGKDEVRTSGGWWDWNPSKTALEYLWRTGHLAITARQGFRKIYDLTERVIPPEALNARVDEGDMIAWACASALQRLGFATSGEIAAFYALLTPKEAKAWVAESCEKGTLVEVDVEGVDGSLRRSVMTPAALHEAENTPPKAGNRLRILSPFDPALRDRKRAERLFGFQYRIEVFVPEAKRIYGYYVFPVLEGDRLIGRIDMKAHRAEGHLNVKGFWAEADVDITPARQTKLRSEILRFMRLSGCEKLSVTRGPKTKKLDWLNEET